MFNRKYKLQKKIYFLLSPAKSNDIIDLRASDRGKYYLHNTTIEVGNICFRGYHSSDFLGDIGYTVFEEYRSNNYAYKALFY